MEKDIFRNLRILAKRRQALPENICLQKVVESDCNEDKNQRVENQQSCKEATTEK